MGIKGMVMEWVKKEGVEKGRRETKTQVVQNLLSTGKFTITEIANFTSVSESFGNDVKNGLV